jgi:hypothetical protein
MSDIRPQALPDLYAYRRLPGSPPVLCEFRGEHEIQEGEFVVQGYRGPLKSVCGAHMNEGQVAIFDLLHQEEEAVNPKLKKERHG